MIINLYKKKILLFIIIFNLYSKEIYFKTELIKVGYYCNSLKNGGVERVMSILINYLSKEKIFTHYLITKQNELEGEYSIPQNIVRISLFDKRISLIEVIKENHIDILIYNFYNKKEIEELNKLNTTKIIYYDHSSYFLWIYQNKYHFNDSVYCEYQKCNYIISLIPFEND